MKRRYLWAAVSTVGAFLLLQGPAVAGACVSVLNWRGCL